LHCKDDDGFGGTLAVQLSPVFWGWPFFNLPRAQLPRAPAAAPADNTTPSAAEMPPPGVLPTSLPYAATSTSDSLVGSDAACFQAGHVTPPRSADGTGPGSSPGRGSELSSSSSSSSRGSDREATRPDTCAEASPEAVAERPAYRINIIPGLPAKACTAGIKLLSLPNVPDNARGASADETDAAGPSQDPSAENGASGDYTSSSAHPEPYSADLAA
jgi:hypothetical protein